MASPSLTLNDFSLLNIDILVEATSDSPMFSFMDRSSGYNQIEMHLQDVEKMAFRTPVCIYSTIMPFGLKFGGTTYPASNDCHLPCHVA